MNSAVTSAAFGFICGAIFSAICEVLLIFAGFIVGWVFGVVDGYKSNSGKK